MSFGGPTFVAMLKSKPNVGNPIIGHASVSQRWVEYKLSPTREFVVLFALILKASTRSQSSVKPIGEITHHDWVREIPARMIYDYSLYIW